MMPVAGGAGAIDFYAADYVLTREAAGDYVNGKWVSGTATPQTIRAAVFQPTARDILKLPEGDRQKVEWVIWTRFELVAGEEDDATRGDIITVKGRNFRVFKLADRSEGSYNKGYLQLVANRGRSV